MTPADRRGRIIGLYGLAIWGGLALGPPAGELILQATSFEMVWAFAAAAPLLGALCRPAHPRELRPRAAGVEADRRLISREALRPGLGLSLAIVGYATMAAFVVLHLDEQGVGHGAAVFTAFAASVVAMRVLGGGLPDRYGSIPCIIGAGVTEAAGLLVIAAADSIAVAVLGAVGMGAGFALLFPSLALLVVNRVPEERRGVAMGTFTAFFDLGMGIGSPLVGAAAAIGGYEAAFVLAAACALATIAVARLAAGGGRRDSRTRLGVGLAAGSVDQATAELAHRQPPHRERERDEDQHPQRVRRLQSEGRAAHQLDQLVERVEVAPATWKPSGSWSIGKNVPATRNSGVITSVVT